MIAIKSRPGCGQVVGVFDNVEAFENHIIKSGMTFYKIKEEGFRDEIIDVWEVRTAENDWFDDFEIQEVSMNKWFYEDEINE